MQSGQTAAGLVQLQTVISDFNTKLLSRISTFKSSNSGVKTYVWDAWTAFTQILNNPTAYGFADNTTYGSAPTDFWGNNYHPSSKYLPIPWRDEELSPFA
jgi:phospholipase/lecithinase/hemolysin